MRKCWLPAFFPFPTIFSKGFFPMAIKSKDCLEKGKIICDTSMLLQKLKIFPENQAVTAKH